MFSFDFVVLALTMGVGATIVMDIWSLAIKYIYGVEPLSYGRVGQWVLGLTRSELVLATTRQPSHTEVALGWTAHYLIGIAFAIVFVGLMGAGWMSHPTLPPALVFGAATVSAPYFILQPALGAGIAASKTPRPNVMRARSFVVHLVFGSGLYIAAKLVATLNGSQ